MKSKLIFSTKQHLEKRTLVFDLDETLVHCSETTQKCEKSEDLERKEVLIETTKGKKVQVFIIQQKI